MATRTIAQQVRDALAAVAPPMIGDTWQYRVIAIDDVHDGDTVTIRLDVGFDTHKRIKRGRLWGIDAPELATERGPIARDMLRTFLSAGKLMAQTIARNERGSGLTVDKPDKYGGYLLILWRQDGNRWLNVNLAMLDGDWGVVAYDGGQKLMAPA